MQDELTQSIRLLNQLAQKLKARRMAAGALNLASPEVKIQLDSSESSDPIDVEQKELRETNSLVEEFMLLANVSVAQKVQEAFPQTAVLRYAISLCLLPGRFMLYATCRRHMPPPKTNFEKLQDILLKRKGLKLDASSSGALAASLDQCIVRPSKTRPHHHISQILLVRTHQNQHSIRWYASWRLGACCRRNISAPEW